MIGREPANFGSLAQWDQLVQPRPVLVSPLCAACHRCQRLRKIELVRFMRYALIIQGKRKWQRLGEGGTQTLPI